MSTAMGQFQYVPLSKLTASPLNHRKYFDKAKMAELQESIGVQGVLQPIVARPLNGDDKFEVVAGERRYRAAKALGLADIPAVVRELTDAQAIEIQVIENGQRENVHPLEEAEGYEALLACPLADGRKYSADDIAAKVGKSRSYIFGRLKLTALCKEAREAFYADKVDASKALLVARISGAELQKKALGEITRTDYNGRLIMNYKDAQAHIQREYMLQLGRAPFSTGDADLVKAAGACTACPKRTGNQPELFGDVKSADVCTDPACFDSKRSAHVVRLAAAAKKNGQEVITGKEAKKLMPYGSTTEIKGMLALDEKCWDDPKTRTYRAIFGKDAPPPVLIENPQTGALVEVVRTKDVADLLKTKVPKKAASSSGGDEKWRVEQRKRDQKIRLAREINKAIYAPVREKIAAGLGSEDVRLITAACWNRLWHDAKKFVAPIWFPDEPGKKFKSEERLGLVSDAIPTMKDGELMKLMLDCAMASALMNDRDSEDIEALAVRHGIDAAGIRAEITAAAKEKDAAKKAKKGKTKKGAKS